MSAVAEVEALERNTGTANAVVTTPMALIAMAMQQNADIDKLTALMALQERWDANEARKQFVAAMAIFKGKPLEIRKNKRVNFTNKNGGRTSYMHATLDNVCEKIIAGLSAVGISHKWTPEQKGNLIKVTCVLTHAAGHSETTSLEATADDSGGKNAIQAVGSTVSYLERYTILAATGLSVKDQDDDGAAAGPRKADPETVYRVEPRTVVEQPTARAEPAPRDEGRARAAPPPVNARPMDDRQRKILTAKMKNASVTDTDLQTKFGKSLADNSWNFDDFNAVATWIASRR